MDAEAQAAQVKANRLNREARNHKRASRRERDKAVEKREQLRRWIAACQARGITVTINNTEPEGGHGGNQQQTQERQDRRP